jgi:hypothetical protein
MPAAIIGMAGREGGYSSQVDAELWSGARCPSVKRRAVRQGGERDVTTLDAIPESL